MSREHATDMLDDQDRWAGARETDAEPHLGDRTDEPAEVETEVITLGNCCEDTDD